MNILSLSLIIPTRNRLPLLKRLILSLVKQSPLPDEVIIVDNSDKKYNDANRSIILRIKSILAENNINLKWICSRKKGSATARNIGIKNASCNYLVFVDDDCFLEKNFFFFLRKHILENQEALIMTQVKRANKDSLISGIDEFLVTTMFEQSDIDNSNRPLLLDTKAFAIKKNLIDINSLRFDSIFNTFSVYEDVDFGKTAILKKIKILRFDDCIVYHNYCSNIFQLIKRNWQKGQAAFLYKKKWEKQNKKMEELVAVLISQNEKFMIRIQELKRDRERIMRHKYIHNYRRLTKNRRLFERLLIDIIISLVVSINKLGFLFEFLNQKINRKAK